MKYYPVNLDIRGRRCLVVGGGAVGRRKVKTLLDCGAAVTLVSPKAVDDLVRMADRGEIVLKQKSYQESDLDGMFLVIGATDKETLNRRIRADAEKRNMLCNIADFPAGCNFILPAVIRRGDLSIAISTSGSSPAFARHLRKSLEGSFGPEYGVFLDLMRAVRKKLLCQAHAPEQHKPLFERLIAGDLPGMIRDQDIEAVDALLLRVLGEGFLFEELMAGDPCNS